MPIISQELPYVWQPSRNELNSACWTILAAFNETHYADDPRFQTAQAELEEWQQDSDVRVEVQFAGFIFPLAFYPGDTVTLPDHTYIRFKDEGEAAHFKLRWL